jgi:hypothetical protein
MAECTANVVGKNERVRINVVANIKKSTYEKLTSHPNLT